MASRRNVLKWSMASAAALLLPRRGSPLSAIPGSALGSESGIDLEPPDLASFGDREDEPFWSAVRKHFVLDPEVVYLNNGSLGPPPRSVLRDLAGFARELAGNPTEKMWGPLGNRLEEVRSKVASLAGASPDDIALTRNTTEGIGTVGMGLGLQSGDEVITTDQEHPGGSGVWQFLETRGVRRIPVPLPIPPEPMSSFLDRLAAALSPRTRVLAVPHLSFGSGHLLPLSDIASLARKRSLLLAVDGAHPPGMLPVDLKSLGCDTYASSSHKWLLSPPGTGFLYARAEARERISPRIFTGTGFTGKTARRYDDFGTRNLAEVLAQGSAIDFHRKVGPTRAHRRIQALTRHLREGLRTLPRVKILTPSGPAGESGLTAFALEGLRHDAALARLGAKGHFVLRAVPELDAIRVSTGIYNSFAELDLFLEALRGALAASA